MRSILYLAFLPLAVLFSAHAYTQACAEEGALNELTKYNTYGGVTQSAATVAEASCGDAFKLEVEAVLDGAYNAGFQIKESEGVDDVAGKRWRLSFRYRSDSERPFGFLTNSRLRGTYGDGGDLRYAAGAFTATTDWQTYTVDVTSQRQPGDTDYHFYMLWALGESTVPLYIDDIVLEERMPSHTVPATFYVRPDGDDTNDGRSNTPGGARRTLSASLGDLIAGDTLLIADGTYAENDLKVLGLVSTADRPTVIRSINKWGAKIVNTNQYNVQLQIENSAHVIIDGLEVYSEGTTIATNLTTGIQIFGSNHVAVRNSFVHDCGCGGISGRESDYMTIERNIARDNAKLSEYNCSGISIYQPKQLDDAPGPHIVIRDNVVFENECRQPFAPLGFTTPTDGNGIILDDFNNTQDLDGDGFRNPPFVAETVVENNLAFRNGGGGIKIFEVKNATIRNNTVWHNNYVLEEFTAGLGEIGLQTVNGSMQVYNNIAIKAFGQRGNALFFQPEEGGTLTTRNNIFVGNISVRGTTDRQDDQDISEDRQSYPRFAQLLPADLNGTSFSSIDDFKQYFGLRTDSPALNAGAGNLASMKDLNGVNRPQDGQVDIGSYEGSVAAVGPLTPDLTLNARIESTPEPAAIDGVREGFYTSAQQTLTKPLIGTRVDPADLSASWRAIWDATNLYLTVEVTDDNKQNDSDNSLEDDGVSILLDALNDKSSTLDADDLHLLIGYGNGGTVEDARTGSPTDFSGAIADTPTGYTVEVAIPWSALGGSATDARVLGIEVIVNDDDDGGATLEEQLAWQSIEVGAVSDPSLFGEATLATVAPLPIIGKTANPITVDGSLDDQWGGVTVYDLDIRVKGESKIAGSTDLAADWRSQWDATNLYFFISVTDDVLVDNSDDWYDDDGIEIYIDADNSKNFTYGDRQYQLTVEYGGEDAIEDRKGNLGAGAVSSLTETATGYTVEVAIPWTALGVTPTPGLFLGLDVHAIDDDDEDGPVDSKLTWYAEIDNSYQNPALFGTAYLQPDTDVDPPAPAGRDTIFRVSAPERFSAGETFQVTVDYASSTTRDVYVRLETAGGNYTLRADEARQTVTAGEGTLTFNLTAYGDVPPGEDAYQLQTVITTEGGSWMERLNNLTTTGLDCIASTPLPAPSTTIGEVGTSTTNHNWKTVALDNTYANPVVIMGALGMGGSQPATIRVRNVTPNSFEWRVDEWEYLDEGHAQEPVDYLVVEAGRHTLANGLSLEAGTTSLRTSFKTISYSEDFGQDVSVFASCVTENEAQAVAIRMIEVNSQSFSMRLQEEENGGTGDGNRSHASETVAWLAVTRGSSNGTGVEKTEAGVTTNSVKENLYPLLFTRSYGSDKRFFLQAQTQDGGDAGLLRYLRDEDYASGTGANIFYQEEKSRDDEVKHTTEQAGYLLFDGSGNLLAGKTTPPTTTTLISEYLYEEGLASNWYNYSYGGAATLDDATANSGQLAAAFTSQDNNGALSFYGGTAQPGDSLHSIRFYARSADGNFVSRVNARTDVNTRGPETKITITPTYQEFTLSASQLGNPTQLQRIDWVTPLGKTLYIDDVRLVYERDDRTKSQPGSPTADTSAVAGATSVTVSPNPNNGRFTVSYTSAHNFSGVQFELYDPVGRRVDERRLDLRQGLNTLPYDLPAGKLATGIYLLRASYLGSQLLQSRVVVE